MQRYCKRITAICLFIYMCACLHAQTKALWVTPWDISSEDKVQKVVKSAKEWGITDLLVEVRYRGDALYTPNRIDSTYRNPEKKSYILTGDKSFDALQRFLELTRNTDIHVHAWVTVNVVSTKNTSVMPKDHVYFTHPEWFTYHQSGRVMNASEFEGAYLDPALDQVKTYLVNIFSDIVRNYPVYGLHLDYIRYPQSNFGYHPQSLDAYYKQKADLDLQTFADWKEYHIYDLVKKINASVKRIRPALVLTAATVPNIQTARNWYSQDWHRWLDEHIIDNVYIMNYTTRNNEFSNILSNIPYKYRDKVVIGMRAWSDDGNYAIASLREKINLLPDEYAGICFFSHDGIIKRSYQSAITAAPLLAPYRTPGLADIAIGSDNFSNENHTPQLIYSSTNKATTTTPPPITPPPTTNNPPLTTPPPTTPPPTTNHPPLTTPPPSRPITTAKADFKVEGYVFGFNSLPLKGAKVTSAADSRIYTFTDDKGYFIINTRAPRNKSFVATYMNYTQTKQATSETLRFNLSVFPTQIFAFNFAGVTTDKGIFLYWDSDQWHAVNIYRKSLVYDDTYALVGRFETPIAFHYDQGVDTSDLYEYQLVRDTDQRSFIFRPKPVEHPWNINVAYKDQNIQLEIVNSKKINGHWYLKDLLGIPIANGYLGPVSHIQNIPLDHFTKRFLILHYTIDRQQSSILIDLLDISEKV